jgi:Ca-activated chloride channel family protein
MAGDKLPLAQASLRMLTSQLGARDTVALVTYAGQTRVVLEPTPAAQRAKIFEAIDSLTASGSTAMSSGLDLAYQLAAQTASPESISRVLVLSDGDANVGATGYDEMLAQVADQVKKGVTLSTVGFGEGNYQDATMERLADKGNGNYAYIDSISQAKRVFAEQLGGTLEVIAKDVKIQVDFDPRAVARYRLLGYENRVMDDRDFRNDKADAGEIGAGQSVTALYEVELVQGAPREKLATVHIRAKQPSGDVATEDAYPFAASMLRAGFEQASPDLRFAVGVAGFAEVLRKDPQAAGWKLAQLEQIVRDATNGDADREELLALMQKL